MYQQTTIVGNLGKDPEMRYTPNGRPVTSFSVATTRTWTSAEGERREETEWFNIVAWGNLAEICKQYLTKGQQVYVEGRLQTRQWEDQSGNKRYTTELIANRVQSLERRDREGEPPFPGDEPGGVSSSRSGSGSAASAASDSSSAGGTSSGGTSGPTSSAEDFDDLPF